MEITFRSFKSEDAEEVQQVAQKSWTYTYSDIFTEEKIQKFIDHWYDPDQLRQSVEVIKEGRTFFQVADHQNKVIGFIQLGPTDPRIQLFRIYILPEYIGKGIGKQLLNLAEEYVLSTSNDSYYCFVHKDNEIGKNFYLKNGFEHIPSNDTEEEWYMIKSI